MLAAFSDKAHDYAAGKLAHNGVILRLATGVTEIAADRVTLSDGTQILTRTVVWAGGIQAPELAGKMGLPQGRGGRLTVEADLTVEGFPGVYAIGDIANIPDPDGNDLPQLGSVALQAGRWAAENIVADIAGKPRKPFHYKDKGIMAMIGDGAAVAEMGAHHHELHGHMAFAAWLGVHAWLMSGVHQRVDAFVSWALGLPRLRAGRARSSTTRRRADRLGRQPRGGTVTDHYDVIIIGSGAGGGTLAHTLAASGKQILLLERGNYLPREMDNWRPEPVFIDGKYISKDTWYDADGKPFQPQVHYNVGGATKLYGAALYRLRPQDFGEIRHIDGLSPAWPLSYDDFEPWYSKAEWLYQVHGNAGEDPTEGPRSEPYPWPAVSHEPRIQQLVRRDGRRRLPPVPRPVRHPARRGRPGQEHVHPLHVVRRLPLPGPRQGRRRDDRRAPDPRPAQRHPARRRRGDPARHRRRPGAPSPASSSPAAATPRSTRGDIVVVSAGASNSAKLLLRSANDQHPHGLANGSDQVGRNYMFHNCKAIVALAKEPNDTVFQKTVGHQRLLPRGARLRLAGRQHPDDRQVQRRSDEGRGTQAHQAGPALLAGRGRPPRPRLLAHHRGPPEAGQPGHRRRRRQHPPRLHARPTTTRPTGCTTS